MGIDVGKQTPGIEDGHDDWAMEPTAMPKTAAVTRKAIVCIMQVSVTINIAGDDGIGRGICSIIAMLRSSRWFLPLASPTMRGHRALALWATLSAVSLIACGSGEDTASVLVYSATPGGE
jgi:hypothetical protein